VAHPYLETAREAGEETIRFEDLVRGFSELALVARDNYSAELLGEKLHPVADAQNRDAESKKTVRKIGAAGPADGIGASGEYHTSRVQRLDPLHRGGKGNYLAVDRKFAHAACDELGILRTKVEDQDGFAMNGYAPGKG
jgi:hypothetical protein